MNIPYYISLFQDHCVPYYNTSIPIIKTMYISRRAEWLSPEYNEDISILVSIKECTVRILHITHNIGSDDQLIKFRMIGDGIVGIKLAALRYDAFSPYKLFVFKYSETIYSYFDVRGVDYTYHSSKHVLPPNVSNLYNWFKNNRNVYNECIARKILSGMDIHYPLIK